jgi:hypothetical protein
MTAISAPLRLAAFRRLLAAYFVGRAGDWFGQIALSVVVLERTGSAFAVALLWMVSSGLPSLFAPLVKRRLRTRSMGRVLVGARPAEGLLFGALALSAAIELPFEVLLALALLDGILNLVASGLTKPLSSASRAPPGARCSRSSATSRGLS